MFFVFLLQFASSHRTYGELDVLFAAKVPARKFASTTIDQFRTIEQEAASVDVEKSSVSEKYTTEDEQIALAALSK